MQAMTNQTKPRFLMCPPDHFAVTYAINPWMDPPSWARGLIDAVRTLPDGVVLEGAGDCVWDEARNLFWMGYGPRSDRAAARVVEATFGAEVVPLELADPRFYHIDTALSPLPGGELVHVPGAFTAAGRAAIAQRTAAHERIVVP